MAGQISLIVKLPLPKKMTMAKESMASSSASRRSVLPETTSSTSILNHVTQTQLVLALTIQKSRPDGITTKEYCEQLRSQIKREQRTPERRYVDSAEFWKDQYTRIYSERKELEDKLHCAKESNRLFRQAIQENENSPILGEGMYNILPDSPDTAGHSSHGTSWKRPFEDLGGSHPEESTTTLIPLLADDDLLRLSNFIFRIKRHRCQLEEAGRESDTMNQINDLMKHTTHMLALLDTSFFACCTPFYLLKTNTEEGRTLDLLQRIMNHVGLSFLACFKSFNELCRTIPGRAKQSELTFKLVMFFNKTLEFLKTLNVLQAEHQASSIIVKRTNKRARAEESEYAVNKYLTKMLSSVAYSIEWNAQQPGHSDLLEGILFSILEHTGRLVSQEIFNEHIAASNSPGNITQGVTASSKPAACAEARYIVQILHATIGSTERKDLVSQVLAAGKKYSRYHDEQSSANDVLSSDLFLRVKKLLQSTLMKSAVGGEELETLRLPTPPAEGTEASVQDFSAMSRYGSDWLVETVCALVGWDLVE